MSTSTTIEKSGAATPTPENTCESTGIVVRKAQGVYLVETADNAVTCSISNRLRKVLIYPTADKSSVPHQRVQEVRDIKQVDPVALGDCVQFLDNGDGTGMITQINARKSALSRSAAGGKPLEQVIVANADQVIAVIAAAVPNPRWQMLDRYLAGAEASEIPAVIVVTKVDLVDADAFSADMQPYRDMGYPVLLTSAETGAGIDAVREILGGKLSVIVGMSGVGKSSLLNAVQPDLGLRVKDINVRLGKGRHTTTHLEMFALNPDLVPGGGSVVDTPGIKTFGLWNITPEDVPLLFRDIRQYSDDCKFGASCTHHQEPGCAVKAALHRGEIDVRRYDNYLYIRNYLKQLDK